MFTPIPEGVPVLYDTPQIFGSLVELYGRKCQVPTCNGRSATLIVEHINGNKGDYSPENLRLACKSCNQTERKFQVQHPTGNTGKLEREKTAATESAPTNDSPSAKAILESKAMALTAPTFTKSKEYKRAIRILLMQATIDGNDYDYETAVYDIVARVGCVETKAREYINGFSMSKYAPFRLKNEGNTIVRNEYYAQFYEKYASDEYRRADREADRIIMEEKALKLAEQQERIEAAQLEGEANKLHIEIMRQIGGYIQPSALAISLVDYLQNPKRYQSNGMDGPTCLKCGQRKPMDHGQLVCISCRAIMQNLANTNLAKTSSVSQKEQDSAQLMRAQKPTIDNGNGHANAAGAATTA